MLYQWIDFTSGQYEAAQHIQTHAHCAVWRFMGGGKSASTLAAYKSLVESGDARRALVVAPLRVARSVWSKEVQVWADFNGIEVVSMAGQPNAQARFDAMRTDADIHTINRENLRWLEAQFIEGRKQFRKWPWDMVVLDESQSFRSQSSQRWKSMRRLRRLTKRIVELSGTPSPNGYGNLWSQIYLLDQGKRLGSSEDAYKNRWFDPPENAFAKWTLKGGAKEEIQARLADIVLSQDEDLELPSVLYNPINVPLSVQALKKYRQFKRDLLTELNSRTITAVNGGAAYGKLLQMANGAVYYDDKRSWTLFHDTKIEALLELLDSTDGPVLICYGFRHDLERLKKALIKFCGKQKTWDVLKTQASEDNWNAGLTDYLLLHPASAGHGLNLQHSGSETIVWFGLTNDLEMWQQANARLIGGHRRAGRNIVVHTILAEQTQDEPTLALLTAKEAEQSDLISTLAKIAKTQ